MSKITILGSAAAEGIPAMFCNCRVCAEAWKNGGKDIRMRAAYKFSDTVRLDFGPDSLAQEHKYKLHSENLKHLFISHHHEDHLYENLLYYRMPGFSVVPEDSILNIYGSVGVINYLDHAFRLYPNFKGDYKKFRLNLVMLEPFKAIELPDGDMTWYPMPADHMLTPANAGAVPLIYVIRSGAKYAMIANDTGYFGEATWKYLEEKRFKLDLVISDCTGGLLDIERGHMSGKYMLAVKKRLEGIGSVTPSTKYVINHFSHNGKATHSELEARYNPCGIEVGFDGMEIKY